MSTRVILFMSQLVEIDNIQVSLVFPFNFTFTTLQKIAYDEREALDVVNTAFCYHC